MQACFSSLQTLHKLSISAAFILSIQFRESLQYWHPIYQPEPLFQLSFRFSATLIAKILSQLGIITLWKTSLQNSAVSFPFLYESTKSISTRRLKLKDIKSLRTNGIIWLPSLSEKRFPDTVHEDGSIPHSSIYDPIYKWPLPCFDIIFIQSFS